jgi:hypothetical protein
MFNEQFQMATSLLTKIATIKEGVKIICHDRTAKPLYTKSQSFKIESGSVPTNDKEKSGEYSR